MRSRKHEIAILLMMFSLVCARTGRFEWWNLERSNANGRNRDWSGSLLLSVDEGLTLGFRRSRSNVGLPPSNLGLYSWRNASIGCTPAARLAGIQLAASATASRARIPAVIVVGSYG